MCRGKKILYKLVCTSQADNFAWHRYKWNVRKENL